MSDFLHSDDEGHVDPDQPMKDFYSQAPDLMVMSQYFVETKDGAEQKRAGDWIKSLDPDSLSFLREGFKKIDAFGVENETYLGEHKDPDSIKTLEEIANDTKEVTKDELDNKSSLLQFIENMADGNITDEDIDVVKNNADTFDDLDIPEEARLSEEEAMEMFSVYADFIHLSSLLFEWETGKSLTENPEMAARCMFRLAFLVDMEDRIRKGITLESYMISDAKMYNGLISSTFQESKVLKLAKFLEPFGFKVKNPSEEDIETKDYVSIVFFKQLGEKSLALIDICNARQTNQVCRYGVFESDKNTMTEDSSTSSFSKVKGWVESNFSKID